MYKSMFMEMDTPKKISRHKFGFQCFQDKPCVAKFTQLKKKIVATPAKSVETKKNSGADPELPLITPKLYI